MNIRLTQIDGKLPNLALMKLSHWHKAQGHAVHFTRKVTPELFESDYDRVYGSAIFTMSAPRQQKFMHQWPDAILAGTGTTSLAKIEEITGTYEHYDYDGWPDFDGSIGFSQRGCRLKCKFCVVPTKEGKPESVNTIADIWRGEGYPKHIHLLDNDFFGQEQWRERVAEIVEGGFKVCLNQGINVRLINQEAAEALATIKYYDDQFKTRRLYTAWDNIGDEKIFFRGIDMLEAAGVPSKHVMAYMLIGFDHKETWERIFTRFNAMVERGIKPYPMVFDPLRKDLKRFQRWVITGMYNYLPWDEYGIDQTAAATKDNKTMVLDLTNTA